MVVQPAAIRTQKRLQAGIRDLIVMASGCLRGKCQAIPLFVKKATPEINFRGCFLIWRREWDSNP
jgi:hypothetical protein